MERYDKELETWSDDDGDGLSREDWRIIEEDIFAEKMEQLTAEIDEIVRLVMQQIAQFKRQGKDGKWYANNHPDVDSHL